MPDTKLVYVSVLLPVVYLTAVLVTEALSYSVEWQVD
jgi:hypothetical protein